MSAPFVLGGITVPLHAGAPEVTFADAGGFTDVELDGGNVIRSRHHSRSVVTISGTGWMATGLDALNWDARHELLCPKPKRVSTTGTSVVITTDARPDVPVACHALVGRDWVQTPVSMAGRTATITPVAGASQYSVVWYPMLTVLCQPPSEDASGGSVSWQIVAREVDP
jgi:hypothetical protein